MLKTAFGQLSHMFLSRVSTGVLRGFTALSEIVEGVHDTEKVENHRARKTITTPLLAEITLLYRYQK